jgi:hypothetical protein
VALVNIFRKVMVVAAAVVEQPFAASRVQQEPLMRCTPRFRVGQPLWALQRRRTSALGALLRR